MKRALMFLPLLALGPLGHFLGSYLEGARALPSPCGFLLSVFSTFLLPWVVAALFLTVRVSWLMRTLFFLGALVTQGFLFSVSPPGATSEMMGIAHRLRHEFPPEQMKACAANLRQRAHDGKLTVRQGKKAQGLMREGALVVDDSELLPYLRGRFQTVFIQPEQDARDQRVYFSIDGRTGIICDSRKQVREFFVCSMADGVHAYRYQRL